MRFERASSPSFSATDGVEPGRDQVLVDSNRNVIDDMRFATGGEELEDITMSFQRGLEQMRACLRDIFAEAVDQDFISKDPESTSALNSSFGK